MNGSEEEVYESVPDYGNVYEDVRDENLYESVPGAPER